MPRQSDAAKRRMEKLIYLAKEDPGSTYDLSDCEMRDVPSGTFSFFKVVRKEALLLHDNRLSSLKGGGNLNCLAEIRVLDLHNNEFSSLPDELCALTALQILRVDGNKLKKLPENIGNLHRLQTLNCSSNPLSGLPASVYRLTSLRTLDITNTRVTSLDKQTCRLHTLENLIVSADQMKYPTPDVCRRGTEAMMRQLCADSGVSYQPPTAALLEVLDVSSHRTHTDSSDRARQLQRDDEQLQRTLQLLDKMKYEQQQTKLLTHEALQRQRNEEALLAASKNDNHSQLVQALAQEQERLDLELEALSQMRELQRTKLVDSVLDAERSADELISQLTSMSERSKNADRLLEQLERERMEMENWMSVHQAEVEQIRKEDVIATMKTVLAENESFQRLLQKHMDDKHAHTVHMQAEEQATNSRIEDVILSREIDHSGLVADLQHQEQLQRDAFEALLREKDERCCRLVCQIELVQQELLRLTLLECERRKQQKNDQEGLLLAERRICLSEMLMNLIDQRDQREKEIKQRLVEMEQARDDSQAFYWLVQYQRLMDRKPQEMIDRETNLEIAVVTIVKNAGGSKYLPMFAVRRITIESLCQMTDDELKTIGVRESSIRRLILRGIEAYLSEQKPEHFNQPLKRGISGGKNEDKKLIHPTPSAPPTLTSGARDETGNDVTTHREGECVVCLENVPWVVFLPCGHICCCTDCSPKVAQCPLCRAEVKQRVHLQI